jgi:hypothetical protein
MNQIGFDAIAFRQSSSPTVWISVFLWNAASVSMAGASAQTR